MIVHVHRRVHRRLAGIPTGTYVLILVLAALALGAAGPARADGDPGAQALDALQSVPGLVDSSAAVPVTSDSDSALVTTDGTTTVDVPTDPSQPVDLSTAGGAQIQIGIPNADEATNAVDVAPGVVTYQGSAPATLFAVQVVAAGTDLTPADQSDPDADPSVGAGVRLLTVIQSADAPTDFAFPLTLPDGASIAAQADGSYLIVDANGTPIASIAAVWARDANNAPVPVTYSLDGTTLTMQVDTAGAAFPITADPDLTSCIKAGPSGTTARRNAVVAAAEKYNHTRYIYGQGSACGQTGGGFDCSGLMMYAFAQVNIVLTHYSGAGGDFSRGTPVTPNTANLQPGDLVFYRGDGSSSDPHHVGVYVGNGLVAQALSSSYGVGIWPLTFAGAPTGARRLIP